jgi:hypothetical protein
MAIIAAPTTTAQDPQGAGFTVSNTTVRPVPLPAVFQPAPKPANVNTSLGRGHAIA